MKKNTPFVLRLDPKEYYEFKIFIDRRNKPGKPQVSINTAILEALKLKYPNIFK